MVCWSRTMVAIFYVCKQRRRRRIGNSFYRKPLCKNYFCTFSIGSSAAKYSVHTWKEGLYFFYFFFKLRCHETELPHFIFPCSHGDKNGYRPLWCWYSLSHTLSHWKTIGDGKINSFVQINLLPTFTDQWLKPPSRLIIMTTNSNLSLTSWRDVDLDRGLVGVHFVLFVPGLLLLLLTIHFLKRSSQGVKHVRQG